MTHEEHTELLRQIRSNLSDEGQVSQLLAKLSEDYAISLTTTKNLSEEAEKLRKSNSELKEHNYELFLRVGTQTQANDTPQGGGKSEPEPLKYEDLFNEKGELK